MSMNRWAFDAHQDEMGDDHIIGMKLDARGPWVDANEAEHLLAEKGAEIQRLRRQIAQDKAVLSNIMNVAHERLRSM